MAEQSEFAYDDLCHAYHCDERGTNVIVVEGAGRIGALCEKHVGLDERMYAQNARANLARRRAREAQS